MQKSVVSKVRKAAKSVPSLQEWLLESETPEAQFLILGNPEAVYCIFRNGVCMYVGQSSNLVRRIGVSHSVYKSGDTVCYIPLSGSSVYTRKMIEEQLARQLKPKLGTIRGNIRPFQQSAVYKCKVCRHKWKSRRMGTPSQCPHPSCQSMDWNK